MELTTTIDIFDNLKDEDKKTVLTDLRNIVLKNLTIKNHYLVAFKINTAVGRLETIFQNTNNKDYMSIYIWSEFDYFYDDNKDDSNHQNNQATYCFELGVYKNDQLVSDGILTYTNSLEQSFKHLKDYIETNILG